MATHNDPEPFGYYVLRTVGEKEFAGEFQFMEEEEVPGVAVTPLYMRPEPSATAAEAVAHLGHLLDEARAVYQAAESSGRVRVDIGHYRRLSHGKVLLASLGRDDEAADEAADEARRDAWNEFEGDHLTDGNDGYAPAQTYRACRTAFDAAWNGRNAAEAISAAKAEYERLHPQKSAGSGLNAELLAALKHAVHWHDQLTPEDIARYEAAIAKAEGRS